MSMVYLLEVTKTISKKAKSDLPAKLYQALLKLEVTPQQLVTTKEVDVSATAKDTPGVTEETPVVTEETPVVTEDIPGVTEETPVVTEETPVVTEDIPGVTEETPVVTEETPVVTEETPVVTEETPKPDNVTCHLAKQSSTPKPAEGNLIETETETTPLPNLISASDPETDLDSLPHYVSVIVVKPHHYPRYSKSDATSFKSGLVTLYLLTNHQLQVPKFIIPEDDDTFTYRRGIRKWLHAEWKVRKSNLANIKHLETKRNHHVYVCTLERQCGLLNLPFAYHVPQNSNQNSWKDINLSIPIQQVDNPAPETYHSDDIHYPDVQFRVTTKFNIHLKDVIKTYGDTLATKT